MILIDFKEQLLELLIQAYFEDISTVKKNLKNESVFAYTLYCDSGFVIFSSAVGTRTRFNEQLNILANELDDKESKTLYIETHAAEWDYYGGARLDIFEKINTLTQLIRDADYDGELTGVYKEGDFDGSNYDDFYEFYINLVIELCLKLKEQNSFNTYPFESDILLGLQFADPDKNEKQWVIKVSEKVNSPNWHKKILEAYSS